MVRALIDGAIECGRGAPRHGMLARIQSEVLVQAEGVGSELWAADVADGLLEPVNRRTAHTI